jgi:internalin A
MDMPSLTAEKPPKLRWYQWRLRSLFLLILMVAMGMSWLTVTIQNQRKQKAAVEEIKKAGGLGSVGYEITWLGKLLRDDSLADVTYLDLTGQSVTDDMFVHLEEFKQLQTLALAKSNITDAGLTHLRGLNQLQFLTLDDTEVTDAGLANLQGLRQLQLLELKGTRVTDHGIRKLQLALPKCDIN